MMAVMKISYTVRVYLFFSIIFLSTNTTAHSIFTKVDRVTTGSLTSVVGGDIREVILEEDLAVVPKLTVTFSVAQEVGRPSMLIFYTVNSQDEIDTKDMVFANNILCHLRDGFYVCKVILKNVDERDLVMQGFNSSGQMIVEDLLKKPKVKMYLGDNNDPPRTTVILKNISEQSVSITHIDCGDYIDVIIFDEKSILLPNDFCEIQLSYKNNLHCCNKVIYDRIKIKYVIDNVHLESVLNVVDGLLNNPKDLASVDYEASVINSFMDTTTAQQNQQSYFPEYLMPQSSCHLKVEALSSAGNKMMVVGKMLTLEYKITNFAEETALLTFKNLPPSIYRDVGDKRDCDEHLKSYDSCVLTLLVYPTEPGEITHSYLVFANFFSTTPCHSRIDITLTVRKNIYAQDLQVMLDNKVDEITKQPRTQLHLYNILPENILKIVSVSMRELSALKQRYFSCKKYLLPQSIETSALSQVDSSFFIPLSEEHKEGIIYILEVKYKKCTAKWYERCEKREDIIRIPILKLSPASYAITDISTIKQDKIYAQ